VSLFDDAMSVTSMFGMSHLVSGDTPTRFGHAPNGASPVGLFEAQDGPFYLTCANDRLYRRLMEEVLERPDLARDPRFVTNRDRAANRAALHDVLDGIFATRSREEWMRRLQGANVPAGPVRTIAEAYASAEAQDRGTASEIPHPTAGSVPNIAPPFRFCPSCSATTATDSPRLPRPARSVAARVRASRRGGVDHENPPGRKR
jgi:crotonobetainyl-CoA:carnitine CoA-transferase CaiB-like acyl-CoA transferase